jgi:phosphoribosylformylglycinamidine synthase subunit PurQ / glutaminase
MAPAREARARIAVLVFPGSNDDEDLARALERLGADVERVWHKQPTLPGGIQGVGIPGGFSYGDYLRCGAMARFSPIMGDVIARGRAGLPILGICNGFQILCESGLLPGVLVRNRSLRFVCREVEVHVEDPGSFPLKSEGRPLTIPIKHGEGAYVCDPARPPRVALRYAGVNPNGSEHGIAGVTNEAGNVLGLMPHPEHAVDPLLGGTDGARVLDAFLDRCAGESAEGSSWR